MAQKLFHFITALQKLADVSKCSVIPVRRRQDAYV